MQYKFINNEHGDTIFTVENKKVYLERLFGLNMEVHRGLPNRMEGLFEIFTSLGAVNNKQQISEIYYNDTCFHLTVDLYDGGLEYHTIWQYEKSLGLLKRSDKLTNTGTMDVQLFKALQRYVFEYDNFKSYTQNNRWCYENIGEWNRVTFGGVKIASEGGRTAQGASPYIALKNDKNEGLVFHIIPNGNWQIDFQTISPGVGEAGEFNYMLELGQSSRHFNFTLKPGEVFEFPEVLIQNLFKSSLSQTAVNLQKYFLITDVGRNRIEHPMVYNPWFEHYAVLEQERLREHVKIAKELGCEVFEVDAGWYGSQDGDWWAQSGDWTERTNGGFFGKLRDFVDYVKSENLEFGLWMEPERIGGDTPIRKAKPEFFAWGNGYYYPKLHLPEVSDYIYGEISGLIEKYSLSWMKMDFNFELGEDYTGSEFYLYYRAWYDLLRKICRNYPDTYLEACASGGQRTDINTTTVYDGHFLSDNVNSWDMQAVYQQCALRLPHYRLIKWLVISPGAKISLYDNQKATKIDTVITPQKPGAGWDEYERISIEFACQLTMAGPVGLSGNFIDITANQKDVIKTYVAFYKKYRNFYKESVLHLGHRIYNVGEREGSYHLQYDNVVSGEQLVFIYRYASLYSTYVLYLNELESCKVYEIFDAITEISIGKHTGEELMYRGLSVELESRHSGKILILK
jgi:alpha-galactosidase